MHWMIIKQTITRKHETKSTTKIITNNDFDCRNNQSDGNE